MGETSLYYVKLIVEDPDALASFYCDVFGMKEIRRIHEPAHIRPHLEIFLSSGETDQLALMRYLDQPPPPPGEVRVALKVGDVNAVVAAAQAAGGTIILPVETMEEYLFRWATIADPEGHVIEVMQFGL